MSAGGAAGSPGASCSLPLALVAALLVSPAVASAQDADDCAAASDLFAQGVVAVGEEALARAVERFEQSHRLCPQPGTVRNLALVLEAAGRPAEARRRWAELVEGYGEVISADASAQARERLEALAAELGRLEVVCEPPEAVATVDGSELPADAAEAATFVSPGRHLVECRGSDGSTEAREVDVGAGERMTVAVAAAPPPPPPRARRFPSEGAAAEPSAAPVVASEPASVGEGQPARSFWQGPWPWVIGAAVVVAAVAGAATTAAVLWPEPRPEADLSIQMR